MAKKIEHKELPTWLEQEVLEDILRKEMPDFEKIKAVRVSEGVASGENYATVMLRVQLDVETKDKKLTSKGYMLKMPHTSDLYNALIEKTNIFDTERGMYLDVVPELEQLYAKAGHTIRFGAKAYEIPTKEYYVLLEDLSPSGFKNVERIKGLDQAHTECVLRKLAQWHAASAVRVESRGPYETRYTKGFFNAENNDILQALSEHNVNMILKHIDKYAGYESYVKDLQHIKKKMTEVVLLISEPNPNEFNALNHGDCWSNNIMFNYNDKGEIQETYFVDLQEPKYGTVAQDLYYFLLSSTSLDIKLTKFDYFIHCYHTELVKSLKLLGYKKKLPSLRSIHQALYKYSAWGFFSVVFVMGVVLLDPASTAGATFENFFELESDENSFKQLLFSTDRFIKHMQVVIPFLQYRGAFE